MYAGAGRTMAFGPGAPLLPLPFPLPLLLEELELSVSSETAE